MVPPRLMPWRTWVLERSSPLGVRIPRIDSCFEPLNLVGTRSTASPYLPEFRDAVERVPTVPGRFRGRAATR
jgi:hypothetical protein